MADGRHFDNGFIAIFQPVKTDFNEIWCANTNFASKIGHLTKYQNFANLKWRTAAILKIAFRLYLNDLLSNCHEIWQEEAQSRSDTGHLIRTPNFEKSR